MTLTCDHRQRRTNAITESHRLRSETDPAPARWTLDWWCPWCGSGDLTAEATGKPVDIGTRLTAVARCGGCTQAWQLTLTLQPFGRKRPSVTGENDT